MKRNIKAFVVLLVILMPMLAFSIDAEMVLGDVSGDGELSGMDVNYIVRIIAGVYSPDEESLSVADINVDGNVNSIDSHLVRRSLVGDSVYASGDMVTPQSADSKESFAPYIITNSRKKLVHTYSDRAVDPLEDNSETYDYYPMVSTVNFPDENGEYNTPKVMRDSIRPGLESEGVIVGYDGYMFYCDAIEEYLGNSKFSSAICERLTGLFESILRYTESNGIKYYLVVVPNKSTVYSDYMPEGYDMAEYRKIDQFVEIARETGVKTIDLRDAFERAREELPQQNLFYKYDTHMNNHAGFITYSEIMKAVSKDFPNAVVHEKDEYQINYAETYMKDQAYYLGYYSYFKDYGPVYTLKSSDTATLVDYEPCQGWGQFAFSYECISGKDAGFFDRLYWFKYRNEANSNAPNAYILCDSARIAVSPFLKDSFNTSTYNWTFSFDSAKNEVMSLDTDIVISIVSERNITNYANQRNVTE